MSEFEALNDMINWPVYGLDRKHKGPVILDALQFLTTHHHGACSAYRQILEKLWKEQDINSIETLPFLPVRLFKHERLLSVPQSEVVKTMTSSGTSGKSVSQIFLDKQTSAMQVKVLSRIMGEFIGPRRLPMLVIDCRATVANRQKF